MLLHFNRQRLSSNQDHDQTTARPRPSAFVSNMADNALRRTRRPQQQTHLSLAPVPIRLLTLSSLCQQHTCNACGLFRWTDVPVSTSPFHVGAIICRFVIIITQSVDAPAVVTPSCWLVSRSRARGHGVLGQRRATASAVVTAVRASMRRPQERGAMDLVERARP